MEALQSDDVSEDDLQALVGVVGAGNNQPAKKPNAPKKKLTIVPTAQKPIDEIYDDIVDEFIETYDIEHLDTTEVARYVLQEIKDRTQIENMARQSNDKIRMPQTLPWRVVAKLMLASGKVSTIIAHDGKTVIPVVYGTRKDNYGVWTQCITKDDYAYIREIASLFNRSVDTKAVNEIVETIKIFSKEYRREITHDKNYVPVANGVYNCETKDLIDWDTAKEMGITYVAKLAIEYNPNASETLFDDTINNRQIGFMDIIKDVAGDEEHMEALLNAMAIMVRPDNRLGIKTIGLVDPAMTGSNGKSTIAEILQSIIGRRNYSTTPLTKLDENFALQELPNKMALICTDSEDNPMVYNSGNFKLLAQGEPVTIDVKHGRTIEGYDWHGHMWYCFNGFPKFKDVSDAIDRRWYFIDFNNHFADDNTQLKKNEKIKREYLKDDAELQYILKVLLERDLDSLEPSHFQKDLMQTFRSSTNPVDEFLDEITDEEFRKGGQHWDMYPLTWLYSAFLGWYKQNNNRDSGFSAQKFNTSATFWVRRHADKWEIPVDEKGKPKRVAPGNMMQGAEHFTDDYNVKAIDNMSSWMNGMYRSSFDKDKYCRPAKLKPQYTCMRRVSGTY